MSSTLTEKAVVGRRVELARYRDLKNDGDNATYHPGILTGVDKDGVWIRLDGTRYTVRARTDYEGLRYLDQVVPVPELPMGRFIPVADDKNALWEKAGVLMATIGEDGEDLVLVTDDRAKAWTAACEYFREARIDIDPDYQDADDLRPEWAVFEWEPEDAECPWTVVPAAEGDDMAVHVYYLFAC
ncbi:MAG: hypothetical protein HOY79_04395 [Streptomyces sp.]|nr:hypothetical protein [Streptomyces sp.]NUS15445.1 hypothetical protein [Streptomyces sp.]NUS24097.1 hypothetical protein [Streptomyces sp.]